MIAESFGIKIFFRAWQLLLEFLRGLVLAALVPAVVASFAVRFLDFTMNAALYTTFLKQFIRALAFNLLLSTTFSKDATVNVFMILTRGETHR